MRPSDQEAPKQTAATSAESSKDAEKLCKVVPVTDERRGEAILMGDTRGTSFSRQISMVKLMPTIELSRSCGSQWHLRSLTKLWKPRQVVQPVLVLMPLMGGLFLNGRGGGEREGLQVLYLPRTHVKRLLPSKFVTTLFFSDQLAILLLSLIHNGFLHM